MIAIKGGVSPKACDAYVMSHPGSTGYHRPAWLDVIRRAFGHSTQYLVAASNGRVVGVLPLVFVRSRFFGRFAVSMPFLNYGGVLADNPEVERALLSHAIAETQKAGGTHLELRHTRNLFPELVSRRNKVAMRLVLERSAEHQWQCLDRKVRNQVRKAEKSGVVVEHGGIELLDRFYTVFARNMRDLGTPVYGAQFFREVVSTFPHSTRVFVARLGIKPVAASLVHWHRDILEVPWASSLRPYNALCPNVLLYWETLRFAVQQDMRVFDFGRSTPGEGTFHFKRQWGAEPKELIWEYWLPPDREPPELSPRNPRYRAAIVLWRCLPLCLTNSVGPYVVRGIP
jgi:FemAB-related protein (PEP-CTERM system-associated)